LSTIPTPQGAVKLEEVVVNQDPATLVNLPANSDSLSYINTIKDILADAQRRLGHILWSNGRVAWTQVSGDYRVNLNPDPPAATDIRLRITQSEFTGVNQRNIELVIPGSTIPTLGNASYPILADDLVYIDIDVAALAAANLASITVVDGITNLSATGTAVVRKVSMTAGGLPRTTQSNSAHIPLFMRQDYTVNAVNFTDCWWIPHGIRWPKETTSTLGAIITAGSEAWPQYFAGNESELNTALTQASANGGGIVLLKQAITLTGTMNVPTETLVLARGGGAYSLIVDSGATINLASKAELRGLKIVVNGTTGDWLTMSGVKAKITDSTVSYATNNSARKLTIAARQCVIDGVEFRNTQTAVASGFSFVDVQASMSTLKNCLFAPQPAHTAICVDANQSRLSLTDCTFQNMRVAIGGTQVARSVKLYSTSTKTATRMLNCYESPDTNEFNYQLLRVSVDISSMTTGQVNQHWSGTLDSSVPTGHFSEGFNNSYELTNSPYVLAFGGAVNVFDYPLLAVALNATLTPLLSATFILPDMKGLVAAQRTDGASGILNPAFSSGGAGNPRTVGGSGSHTLTEAQLPSHAHTKGSLYGSGGTFAGAIFTGNSPGMQTSTAELTGYTGSGQSHNNIQPTVIVDRFVKW
jgi:microcystin-dependent protein